MYNLFSKSSFFNAITSWCSLYAGKVHILEFYVSLFLKHLLGVYRYFAHKHHVYDVRN